MMNSSKAKHSNGRPVARWAHWVLPVLILVLGAGIAMALLKTKPQATRKPLPRQKRLVETRMVQHTSVVVRVQAMGTVVPSIQVEMNPRVSGEVTAMADELLPGGRVVKGQTLLQIDPTDYELAHRQARSEVATVQSDVAIEMGRQAVAEQEFDMLGMDMTGEQRDRVLRKPQLDKLKANLDTAEALLEQAALDLSRTNVRAPFNAVVRDRNVNVGAQVSTGTRLATVVGTDTFWIEVTVPVRELRWIRIPRTVHEPGSPVQIHNDSAWVPGTVRTGEVVRLISELEPEGRMARLLIAIHDPLALDVDPLLQPPLLLGEYVRVDIEGSRLEKVVVLDRKWIRDSSTVWLMTDQAQLAIREVGIAYQSRQSVFVDEGLVDGEQIVVTDLSSPVDGLELRTAELTDHRSPSKGAEGRP